MKPGSGMSLSLLISSVIDSYSSLFYFSFSQKSTNGNKSEVISFIKIPISEDFNLGKFISIKDFNIKISSDSELVRFIYEAQTKIAFNALIPKS